MLGLSKILFVIPIHLILVKCAIPSLSVQKVDRKLIERKRQDTLDMCRLFEENELYAKIHQHNKLETNDNTKRRVKRNVKIQSHNPNLKIEDAYRVEAIIDKLYDDVNEYGKQVTYRQRSLPNVTAKTEINTNSSARKFFFAPAVLLGPEQAHEKAPTTDSTIVKHLWIKKWTHGIIPYYIDSNTYDVHLADVIRKAFDYFEKITCIRLQRLRERPTDKESLQTVQWLYISNPSGIRQCVHSNERKPNIGVQMVVFGYDCMTQGEIVHEVMHILGFSHEHTRPDRDFYITVMWNNIKPGYKKYFETHPNELLTELPYDYDSVLHYPPRAFSKNGQMTILTVNQNRIGQRQGLSEIDIAKVSKIFGPECLERNRHYLLNTCPSVVKTKTQTRPVSADESDNYFSNRLWPYGLINFKIRDNMEFSIEERENIKAVIEHIEKETCIEFRDLSNDEEKKLQTHGASETEKEEPRKDPIYPSNLLNFKNIKSVSDNEIKITDDEGRATNDYHEVVEIEHKRHRRSPNNITSPLRRHAANIMVLTRSPEPGCLCPPPGRPNGNKVISINSDCFNSVNDLLHLFVHVLGLDHQHNMHDRDAYLHILWNKLTPEIAQEMKEKLPPAASAGFPYDYQSVMHYPWLQIKNGVTNMMYPIWNDGWAMGHWQGLSSTDVQKLNLIYEKECSNRKRQTISDKELKKD